MGIEKREEVQAEVIYNIFNKIITAIFPNLQKVMSIQVQKASRTPNRLDQNRSTLQHIIIKTTNTENREILLKAIREKEKKRTHKGKLIKITADLSMETLKTKRHGVRSSRH
jgi:hypothetical protein